MTREEAIEILKAHHMWTGEPQEIIDVRKENKALNMAIKSLSQEPCDDVVSREAVLEAVSEGCFELRGVYGRCEELINELPSVNPQPCDDAISRDMALEKMADYVASGYADSAEDFEEYSRIICELPSVTQKLGKCKNCKYFEYDSVAKVDGIPLIVAHEICNKWGNGCKTSEEGYCYLYEPQESEDKE